MNACPVPRLLWPSDAQLVMPGSKSSANRLLVIAAMSGRTVTVRGVTPSDDVRYMIAGLRTLGFAVQHDEAAGVANVGPRGGDAPSSGVIHCGNAGTTLRFLVSVAALTPGEWTLTGDDAMQWRPIGPLTAAWRHLGVDACDAAGYPPVRVRTTAPPRGGRVDLDASQSSQFASSLLLVGAALRDGVKLHFTGALASADYLKLTSLALQPFGVDMAMTATGMRVAPGCGRAPGTVQVDGDWSSMGVWTCLDHLTGSRVHANNLADAPHPDRALADALGVMPSDGEHTIDVSAFPDQFLNLAIVAAHRSGTTRLVGGANLRIKECDRIAVMARELTKLGVDVREQPDGLVVRGGRPLRAGSVDPEHDHRVAMAFALAGLLTPGITIADPDCVTKSYPRFWHDLGQVAAQRRCIAVIGMRGAGKSTFARAFAAATGVIVHDTDARFVAEHGPIGAFVEVHDWPAFREQEERFVAEALVPATIVSTGGGAIESAATRDLLGQRTLVIWLDAPADLLRARLAADPARRPSITGAPVLVEIEALLRRRNPLYAEVGHLRIDAALPPQQQVEQALRELGAPCRWPGSGDSDAARP